MALDEPNEQDKVFELEGLTYLVDATLMDQVRPIKVDYVEDPDGSGFAITSNMSRPEGCGPCSC